MAHAAGPIGQAGTSQRPVEWTRTTCYLWPIRLDTTDGVHWANYVSLPRQEHRVPKWHTNATKSRVVPAGSAEGGPSGPGAKGWPNKSCASPGTDYTALPGGPFQAPTE